MVLVDTLVAFDRSCSVDELREQVAGVLEQVRSIRAGLALHSDAGPSSTSEGDLTVTIQRAVARVRHRFAEDGEPLLQIADLPPIGHRSRDVEQALVEVLNNALDAVDEVGGGHITVSAFPGDGHVSIEITDEGSGIEGDVRERMFVPFVSTKTGAPGLGLMLVKRVVTEHRGRFAIERTPERGTCFRIMLPLMPPGRHVIGALRRKGD